MADSSTEQPKKVTFRFCSECSNMLYPREDKLNHTLIFACRTCQYNEPASSSCVFRNELSNTVGETAGITQDVGSDPTVGYDYSSVPQFCTYCQQEILCPNCGELDDTVGLCVEVDPDKKITVGVREPNDEEAEAEEAEGEESDSSFERFMAENTES